MLRSLAFAAIIAVVVACPVVCFAGPKPLPAAAALESAKRLIIDTFAKELSAADKIPAIKAMLEAAQSTTGDDPAQAALYLSAAEVAARSGETKLAFEAIDSLGRAFECDVLSLKDSLLEAAAAALRKEPGARTTEVRTSIAHRGLELADSAAAAGRFDVAESALKTAGAAASKLRDADLRKELAAKRKELDKARRLREHEQAAYDDAVKTLGTKPDDPAANEAVGKHLAFDRRDWAQGLKYLAKAGDGDLKNAARADRAGADGSGRMTTLGDLWWSLGDDAESHRDRMGYKSRAVFWYTRAANGLSGFARTRLEKRIKEAGDEALAAAAEQTGGADANGKFIDITLAPGVLMRLVKIPASKDGKIKSFYLGQTEVTQKQWVAVMGSNPSAIKGDNLPVNDVLQDDCRLLCERLNSTVAGMRYKFRLPSDDEWLHAFYAGGSLDDFIPTLTKVAWNASNSNGKMQPVGKLSPNPWSLFDMCGNCWEWSDASCHIFGGSYDQPPADQKSHPGPNPMPNDHKSINITVRLAADAH